MTDQGAREAEPEMKEETIRAEIESFMKFDKSTPKDVLSQAKKKLSKYKHNICNSREFKNAEKLILLIVSAEEKLYDLSFEGNPRGAQEIDPSKVNYDPQRDFIGSGVYGRVFRATLAGSAVAIKLPKDPAKLTIEQIQMFRQEANIMSRIRHDNIVHFLGACFNPSNLMIVTDLMSTDLSKLIHENPRPLSLKRKLRIAYESGLGLYWIHEVCGMIHRDLKPDNILIDDQKTAHIGDFGFTQILQGKEMRDSGVPVGTVLYMAPEVYTNQPFDFSSDVHSFGFILFELFTGVRPLAEVTNCDEFYINVVQNGVRPNIREYPNIPEGIMNIAERCWNPDRHKRPPMSEVVDAIFTAIVDEALPPDSTNPANAYWKKHFWGEFVVPWSRFQSVLNTTVTVDQSVFPILEKFISENGEMTMELFQHYFLYFGRWFETPGEPLINEMIELFQAPWYFHEMDAAKAQMLLTGRSGGTFMIRLSAKDRRTPFALSYMVKGSGKVSHNRIHRVSYDPEAAERYTLPGFGSFRFIGELVHQLIEKGFCVQPCGRHPIKDIAYFEGKLIQ